MSASGNNRKRRFGQMQGQEEGTLQKAIEDIHGLVDIWKSLKPEAQRKLKLIIDYRISLLQSTEPPLELDCDEMSSFPKLEHLHQLRKKLTAVEYKDNAVDDAIMQELDAMITKSGIPTPASTEVRHSITRLWTPIADLVVAGSSKTRVRPQVKLRPHPIPLHVLLLGRSWSLVGTRAIETLLPGLRS